MHVNSQEQNSISSLETSISFAVGALDRDQLEETASEAGVQYDHLTTDDELRADVLEAARQQGGLKVFDADNGVMTFGFQPVEEVPVFDPRASVPIPAQPGAAENNQVEDDSTSEIPVLFAIDPVTKEATGTVMPFCSATCRDACTDHGLGAIHAGMASLEGFGYAVHCEQCGEPVRRAK